jgi:sugar porter (SP) family MFS transporter
MSGKSINKTYVFFLAISAAMGGLLFGYDWVVIGGAKPFYERYFGIMSSPGWQGIAMSSALFGCIAGASVAGFITEKYGRRLPLLFSAFLFVVTSLGTGAFNSFALFMVFRILGGVAIGIASNVSPVYIAEIAPASMRGRLVAINQFTIAFGVLAAQLVNMLIAEPVPGQYTDAMIAASWNGQSGWRWMFWACSVPALVFFISMLFVPESPRWLVKAGRPAGARGVLEKIGGKEYADSEAVNIAATTASGEHIALKSLFLKPLSRVVILGIALAVFQQWCGINVIFNYAEEIFSSAGYGISGTLFNIVITGTVSLLFTVLSMFLVDRWGRRALMLTGAGGLAAIYLAMAAGYYLKLQGTFLLVLVVSAIAVYGLTLAPIVWVLLSEIFPNRIRGRAMSVSTLALWCACLVLTVTFPYLNRGLGTSGTFALYALICISGFLLMMKYLPETRQRTLEEIEHELTGVKAG